MPRVGAMNGMHSPESFVGQPRQQARKFCEQRITVINGQQRSRDVELNVGDQRFIDERVFLIVA